MEGMARRAAWTLRKSVYNIPGSYSKKLTYVLQVESREQRFFTSCENFEIDLIHCGLRNFMSKSELTLEEPVTFRTSMDPSVIVTASRTTHTT